MISAVRKTKMPSTATMMPMPPAWMAQPMKRSNRSVALEAKNRAGTSRLWGVDRFVAALMQNLRRTRLFDGRGALRGDLRRDGEIAVLDDGFLALLGNDV